MGNINLSYVETHDEDKPDGGRARSLGDDDIREFKRAIRERLAQDHQFYDSETGYANVGTHKKVTFSETQVADPSTYDDCGSLYIKTVSEVKELFFKDSAGNVTQLTSGGYLQYSSIRWPNNTNIVAKNAAGSGTVNLIKANASDKVEIPDGTVMASSAAPAVDAGIANKKYVDDKTWDHGSQVTGLTDDDHPQYVKGQGTGYKIDSGSIAAIEGETNITFNFTFSAAPKVMLTILSSDTGLQRVAYLKSVSTTGAVVRQNNTGTQTVQWIAIGTV